jgi:hypothetical protein
MPPFECGADLREVPVQSVGRASLDLAHPTICGHYPEICALLAKVPTVVGKMASEDRPMPPTDSLRRHLQPTPPEDSLGIHENTCQLVAESTPGVLRRQTARPVEARALVVLISQVPGFVHRPRMPSDADPCTDNSRNNILDSPALT